MKINLYSLKDVKAGAFMLPFGSQNDATAVRMLDYSVNAPDSRSLAATNPEDVELWRIGSFDDELGTIECKVEFMRTAMSVKRVVEPKVDTPQGFNVEKKDEIL